MVADQEISVQDTRQCLGEVRKMWMELGSDRPFLLSCELAALPMTVGDFCTWYMLQQHDKRHSKDGKKPSGRLA